MRGSPHGHCLLLVKDQPKLGQDSDEEVYTFIDKYITGVLPSSIHENEHHIKHMESL